MSKKKGLRYCQSSKPKAKNVLVSVICSLTLVFSMCPGFTAAAYADTSASDSESVSVESYDENSNYTVSLVAPSKKSIQPGSSFEVKVVGTAANSAIFSCGHVYVSYDSSVVTLGDSNVTSSLSNFDKDDDGNGKVSVSFYGNTSKKELETDGLQIATLKFTVKSDAKAGAIDIKITDGIVGASGNISDQGVKFSSDDLGIKVSVSTEPKINEDGYYEIATAADLKWFANKVNTTEFPDGTAIADRQINAKLVNDIVWDSTAIGIDGDPLGDWVSIGMTQPGQSSATPAWSGSFDGCGHSISGLSSNDTTPAGLFRFAENAIIENVVIKASSFVGNMYGGAILANGKDCVIRNCGVEEDVSVSAKMFGMMGGIAGNVSGSSIIENCYSAATSNRAMISGGFVGTLGDNSSIRNCVTVSAFATAKAIGVVSDAASVENCFYLDTACTSQKEAPHDGLNEVTVAQMTAAAGTEGAVVDKLNTWANENTLDETPLYSWVVAEGKTLPTFSGEYAKEINYIQRVAGTEARDTSAMIATTAWEGSSSEWAILARDDDFADAMSATGLAGALNAPIVLTDREGLSDVAKQTLQSLGVKNVYIAGGTGAMPGDFESELKAAGVTGTIERVYGYESYDTSVKCAEKIVEIDSVKGISAQYAIVAMPSNFQDALSMSSFAYKYHAPIFLQTFGSTSSERSMTTEAQALLTGTGAYAKAQVFVAGGNGAVSDDSLSFLTDYERIGGYTGYNTSDEIAKYMVKNNLLAANTVCIASGAELAKGLDALSGAALAGKNNGVMLLVNEQEGMEAIDTTTIDNFLTDNKDEVKQTYILGGTYVIPQNAMDAIKELVDAVEAE